MRDKKNQEKRTNSQTTLPPLDLSKKSVLGYDFSQSPKSMNKFAKIDTEYDEQHFEMNEF